MGPRAEPYDSIMTSWEEPPAPERALAFFFRDSLLSSCLERGGVTQFTVNRKEYAGQQLSPSLGGASLRRHKLPALPGP